MSCIAFGKHVYSRLRMCSLVTQILAKFRRPEAGKSRVSFDRHCFPASFWCPLKMYQTIVSYLDSLEMPVEIYYQQAPMMIGLLDFVHV